MKHVIIAIGCAGLLAAGTACAAETYNDCNLDNRPERLVSENLVLRTGRLTHAVEIKANDLFDKGGACFTLAPDACPGPHVFRRLGAGEKVWVVLERGVAACVLYPGKTGLVSGWVEAAAIRPVTETVAVRSWIGEWARMDDYKNSGASITIYSVDDFIAAYKKQAASNVPDDLFSELNYDPATRRATPGTVGISGETSTGYLDANGEESSGSGMFIGMSDIAGDLLIYSAAREAGRPVDDVDCFLAIFKGGDALYVAESGVCEGNHAWFWGRYRRARR